MAAADAGRPQGESADLRIGLGDCAVAGFEQKRQATDPAGIAPDGDGIVLIENGDDDRAAIASSQSELETVIVGDRAASQAQGNAAPTGAAAQDANWTDALNAWTIVLLRRLRRLRRLSALVMYAAGENGHAASLPGSRRDAGHRF